MVGGEREAAFDRIVKTQKRFSIIYDFTASDAKDVRAVLEHFPGTRYVFISSMWVTKRWDFHLSCEAPPPESELNDGSEMPEITEQYTRRKIRCEQALLSHHSNSGIIVRLPIVWGLGDHTRRLDFYATRIIRHARILLVNGGTNRAPIANKTDVSIALKELTRMSETVPSILEALPSTQWTVKEWIGEIANGLGQSITTRDVDDGILRRELPEYLVKEPLWREIGIPRSDFNLFGLTGIKETNPLEWLNGVLLDRAGKVASEVIDPQEMHFLGLDHA